MANISQAQRRLVSRLKVSTIPHTDVIKFGKPIVAAMMGLERLGYAECIHPDTEEAYCPTRDSAEGDWQITPEGDSLDLR